MRTNATVAICLLVACSAASACSSTTASELGEAGGTPVATAELEDTYWKLTRVAGHPVMVGEGHREPHLVLRSEDGRLSGFGGCNRLMGTYELDGSSIRFGPVASTMVACPQGEDTEHELAIALELTRSWRIVGQHLELLDEHGEPTARFEARYME